MAKYIVTVTPPTPNGDLHIGHIAGPFLGADVFTRVQRQQGHECVLVSYSDDYQSYMLRKGLETGIDPVELARRNTDRITASLAAIAICPDNWMRPYDNRYFREAVSEVFGQLREAGALTFRDSLEPYCASCDTWGYEAFARGTCNYCGHDSDPSQCENCAQAPDAAQMGGLYCKLCQKPPVFKTAPRAFLKLGDFEAYLRQNLLGRHWRAPLDAWLEETFEHLHDWGVTRPGESGLDLSADGSCRVHTWFMGLAGYMAAFREYAERVEDPDLFNRYWRSGQGTLVNFLGFDCVFSHCVVYPAQLATLDGLHVRQHFMPNQCLKLDGLNLSTSRNHAIWISDLVHQACADSARLYLASISPECSEGDFRLAHFQRWRQDTFGAFFPALIAAGASSSDAAADTGHAADDELVEVLRKQWLRATQVKHFSIRRMAQVLNDVIAITRSRLEEARTVSHWAALIAVMGKALIPDMAARIVQVYGLDEARVTSRVLSGPTEDYSI